jgi:hypothetical protein
MTNNSRGRSNKQKSPKNKSQGPSNKQKTPSKKTRSQTQTKLLFKVTHQEAQVTKEIAQGTEIPKQQKYLSNRQTK